MLRLLRSLNFVLGFLGIFAAHVRDIVATSSRDPERVETRTASLQNILFAIPPRDFIDLNFRHGNSSMSQLWFPTLERDRFKPR